MGIKPWKLDSQAAFLTLCGFAAGCLVGAVWRSNAHPVPEPESIIKYSTPFIYRYRPISVTLAPGVTLVITKKDETVMNDFHREGDMIFSSPSNIRQSGAVLYHREDE